MMAKKVIVSALLTLLFSLAGCSGEKTGPVRETVSHKERNARQMVERNLISLVKYPNLSASICTSPNFR